MGRKVKVHVEGRSKEDRQKIRKALGPLKGLTVQPKTRERYSKALGKFFAYLRTRQLSLPRNRLQVDGMVSDYMEFIWETGKGRSLASDTLAALQDQDPGVKGHLSGSWRLLKTCMANEIPNRAPPFTLEALQTLVGHALFRQEHLFALSLLLGFFGMLRAGELLNVRKRDISQSSASSVAVISLGMTKGGQRAGASESVTISEKTP